MRVLVCGGRDYTDREKMDRVLRLVDDARGPIKTLIHGAARGADSLAAKWARDTGLDEFGEVLAFPANWRDGKRAGPIRNQQMLDEGKPELVIAFPGGAGTADMVRRARAAGVEVQLISVQTRPSNPHD
jgi:hypothetical protein